MKEDDVRDDAAMGKNAGRTVGREGVIKLGFSGEGVDFPDVVEKQSAAVLQRCAGAIQVNVLGRVFSEIGPQADQIALVRNNIEQFVLLKKPGGRRVAFVPLSARHANGLSPAPGRSALNASRAKSGNTTIIRR
jgi:hypothetical protein